MRYKIQLDGVSPIIFHNGAAGLDKQSEFNLAIANITSRPGKTRTEADEIKLREYECARCFYLDSHKKLTIPGAAFRSCLEAAARKSKEGPAVREGVIVLGDAVFEYDTKRYGDTFKELCKTCQFTVPVVVQRARLLRTRAKIDEWKATFEIDTDDELVDEAALTKWLDIAGRRIGLCDWRPAKSGNFGRFTATVKLIS